MNKKRFAEILLIITFVLYIIVLLKITVFRQGFLTKPLFSAGEIGYIPFKGYIRLIAYGKWYQFVYLFFGNLIWFIPFGFYISVFFPGKRSLIKIAAAGFLFSLTIETAQYIFGTGVSEIDDLILNTSGAIAGYIIYKHIIIRRMARMAVF